MSGGAINDSVVIDFTRYMNKVEDVQEFSARTQPGVFYRDFEKATLAKGGLLPSFPASRELAAMGGLVANNSGGEKSLEYGKTEDYVEKLGVVLSDGQSYELKALNKKELEAKKAKNNFELSDWAKRKYARAKAKQIELNFIKSAKDYLRHFVQKCKNN